VNNLLEQRAIMDALFECLGDGVLAVDATRTILVANASARRMFNGVEVGKALPSNWPTLHRSMRQDGTPLAPEDGALARGLRGERTDDLMFTLQPGGSADSIWVEATGRPVLGANGEVIAAVGVYRDATERKRQTDLYATLARNIPRSAVILFDRDLRCLAVVTDRKSELAALEAARVILERNAGDLQKASVTDELTGLLNRRGLTLIAEQEMLVAARTDRNLLLFFVDVNGMKKINDTLGHEMGDRALVDTGHLLRKVFRTSDAVARLGGDEFVVLVTDASATSGPALAVRLRDALAEYNASQSSPFQLSLSSGVSLYDPGKPSTLGWLLSDADARMYEEKRARRLSVHPR
jgi:diguanylate cyclase (GGDEF)-like protein